MAGKKKIITTAFIIALFCLSLLYGGEPSGVTPPDERDAKVKDLVAQMEKALESEISKVPARGADFSPPARPLKKIMAALKGKKAALVKRLGIRLGGIKRKAQEAVTRYKEENARWDRFVRAFHERSMRVAEKELHEKIKDFEGRPQRERAELDRKAHEEHRRAMERINKAAQGTWQEFPKLYTGLQDRYKNIYVHLVDVLKMLQRLGDKKPIPSFEKWTGADKKEKEKPRDRRKVRPFPRNEPPGK
ncbi:MAG: hypothetical protein ACYS8W_09595 [Planctomycetota bacterium]|jgi:hypothetical protein